MVTDFSLFDPAVLAAWARRADADEFVRQHCVLADLCLALRNTQTGEQAWLAVREQDVQAGVGERAAPFWLEGDSDAFADLARGFPFNRLVRQHRLVVGGDLRACVQNWMLLYALTRLTAELEI